MIMVSNDFLPGRCAARTTVCIVGAGPAGITVALELDGMGFDVLLLEAGGFDTDAQVDTDYLGAADRPHAPPDQFRRARLGGTSGIWGGRCVPLDPIDFEQRDYIAKSGWPIAYQEVARFYPKAMLYCDAGHANFSVSESLRRAAPTIEGLEANTTLRADRIERYSRPTDFGIRYRKRLIRSRNITVLLYARCVGLLRGPASDRIRSLEMVDRAGRRVLIHADAVVLAAGGIEVTRLLLNSDPRGVGLGNSHDQLGRYYACHVENICARVVPSQAGTPFFFEKTIDGIYARRKLQFTDVAQRHHRLLNSAFRLHFPSYADARHGSAIMSAIFMAKTALVPEHASILRHGSVDNVVSPPAAHLWNIAGDIPQVLRFGLQMLFLRRLARRKIPYTLVPNADGSFPVEFNCEQTPLAHSRVSLSHEMDRHNLRRVKVEWRVCQDDIDAAYRGFLVLGRALHEHSRCRLEFDNTALRARLAQSVPLGGHHLGTARMAATSRDGVVDRNCALFEVPNLYLASAAVFPTSGHANPTLTIVALAIRLASHLTASYRPS